MAGWKGELAKIMQQKVKAETDADTARQTAREPGLAWLKAVAGPAIKEVAEHFKELDRQVDAHTFGGDSVGLVVKNNFHKELGLSIEVDRHTGHVQAKVEEWDEKIGPCRLSADLPKAATEMTKDDVIAFVVSQYCKSMANTKR